MMNTSAQPQSFTTANTHALATILEASQTKSIIASTDIFDVSGTKLWARDQPVSQALQRKLLDRQLRQAAHELGIKVLLFEGGERLRFNEACIQAWQALAAANTAAGRPVAAVRAEAEVNVAQLDYAAALTRFKAAQDLARKSRLPADHIDASIVDTRARQMESLLGEQALER